jgi:hypothetical protein
VCGSDRVCGIDIIRNKKEVGAQGAHEAQGAEVDTRRESQKRKNKHKQNNSTKKNAPCLPLLVCRFLDGQNALQTLCKKN